MFVRVGLTMALTMLSAIPAMGSAVTISTGGTWGTLSASDAYFVSHEAWTLSIQVESSPAVSFTTNERFVTTYSNAVYTLNGVAVATTGSKATFYTDATFGICLDSACEFQTAPFLSSPSLFSGATTSPTMVPGSYVVNDSGFVALDFTAASGQQIGSTPPGVTVTVTSQGSAAPEPSTWILCGAGLLLAGSAKRILIQRKGKLK
jgi:hypothetical protein